MSEISKLSIDELGAVICHLLREEGVEVTLSGGACAEIYSGSKYVTGDLDFVVNYFLPGNQGKIDHVMGELGFEKDGRIYINEKIDYSVEFPPGPLEIGEECCIQPVKIIINNKSLSLLSPTDSAKDRLTGYFYGNDRQCLEQAIMICQMNKVDMVNIRKWAKQEDCPAKFKEFERLMTEWKR